MLGTLQYPATIGITPQWWRNKIGPPRQGTAGMKMLALLCARGSIRSVEAAEVLGCTTQGALDTLKRLHNGRLVERVECGRELIWRANDAGREVNDAAV